MKCDPILLAALVMASGCSRSAPEEPGETGSSGAAAGSSVEASAVTPMPPDPPAQEVTFVRNEALDAHPVRRGGDLVEFVHPDGRVQWRVDVGELAAGVAHMECESGSGSFEDVFLDKETGKVHVEFGPDLTLILSGADGNLEQVISGRPTLED